MELDDFFVNNVNDVILVNDVNNKILVQVHIYVYLCYNFQFSIQSLFRQYIEIFLSGIIICLRITKYLTHETNGKIFKRNEKHFHFTLLSSKRIFANCLLQILSEIMPAEI